MSKFEGRSFPVGKVKSDLAGLKNQLARLKEDLTGFMARKPNGAVISALRERIRELERQIVDADRKAKAGMATRPNPVEAAKHSTGMHSTAGRFPPRRR